MATKQTSNLNPLKIRNHLGIGVMMTMIRPLAFTLLFLTVAEFSLPSRTADAFQTSLPRHTALSRRQLHASPSDSVFEEFGYLLQESSDVILPKPTPRRLTLGGDQRAVVQTSSTTASPYTSGVAADEMEQEDPFAVDEKLARLQRYQEVQESKSWGNTLQSMDFQDMVITLFVPGLLAFVSGRWILNRVKNRVTGNADALLDSFARELIFHDGDVDEMDASVKAYKSSLLWLGPKRDSAMLKRYLESYAKRRTVSPQGIASLSTVFTMFGLSEAKAGKLMAQLCEEMGTQQMASIGALLFFGSRIFQSVEGKAALEPIKALIKSSYRDGNFGSGELSLETAQQSIAFAAYRNAILEAGKDQKSLTPGWQVLGVDKDIAIQIFNEEKQEGFISDRERMYGGQSRKYDKKGRIIDEDGKPENPNEADEDEEDDDDDTVEMGTSNVYECGNCGFTLFVAEGRQEKFFGPNFKCPECGASKKEFRAPNRDDDE